jgi:hypothetical protein
MSPRVGSFLQSTPQTITPPSELPKPEIALARFDLSLLSRCPSSDDLRQFGCFRKGGSGSSVVEIKRHAGDAANDDLRWSGV